MATQPKRRAYATTPPAAPQNALGFQSLTFDAEDNVPVALGNTDHPRPARKTKHAEPFGAHRFGSEGLSTLVLNEIITLRNDYVLGFPHPSLRGGQGEKLKQQNVPDATSDANPDLALKVRKLIDEAGYEAVAQEVARHSGIAAAPGTVQQPTSARPSPAALPPRIDHNRSNPQLPASLVWPNPETDDYGQSPEAQRGGGGIIAASEIAAAEAAMRAEQVREPLNCLKPAKRIYTKRHFSDHDLNNPSLVKEANSIVNSINYRKKQGNLILSPADEEKNRWANSLLAARKRRRTALAPSQ
jgi:hypothetical protein